MRCGSETSWNIQAEPLLIVSYFYGMQIFICLYVVIVTVKDFFDKHSLISKQNKILENLGPGKSSGEATAQILDGENNRPHFELCTFCRLYGCKSYSYRIF